MERWRRFKSRISHWIVLWCTCCSCTENVEELPEAPLPYLPAQFIVLPPSRREQSITLTPRPYAPYSRKVASQIRLKLETEIKKQERSSTGIEEVYSSDV